MANNKIISTYTAPFPYSIAGNQAFNASCLDELYMFANDICNIEQAAGIATQQEFDTAYIPENLSNAAGVVSFFENGIRQDVKRRVAQRLPRVTLGQGLVLLSQNDNMQSYFINSLVYNTALGYLRVGIANFTSDQATNPFAPGQQSELNAVWAFFDLGEPLV